MKDVKERMREARQTGSRADARERSAVHARLRPLSGLSCLEGEEQSCRVKTEGVPRGDAAAARDLEARVPLCPVSPRRFPAAHRDGRLSPETKLSHLPVTHGCVQAKWQR